MNKLLIILSITLTFGCSPSHPVSEKKAAPDSPLAVIEASCAVKMNLHPGENNSYDLLTAILLEGHAYIISPFSPDTVFGHLDIFLNENNHIQLGETLYETPHTLEEIDQILNTPVRIVRENTMYELSITPLTSEDFDVTGAVWFVLEPACIPYKTEFTLSQRSGKLSIHQAETSKDT